MAPYSRLTPIKSGVVSMALLASPISTSNRPIVAALAARISRRRSSQSARAPDGMPSTSCGAIRAAATTPTRNGEPVTSRVTQLRASWDTTRENEPVDALTHSPANPGMRNGAGSATRPAIRAYATSLPTPSAGAAPAHATRTSLPCRSGRTDAEPGRADRATIAEAPALVRARASDGPGEASGLGGGLQALWHRLLDLD